MKKLHNLISIKSKILILALILLIYPIILLGYFGFKSYKSTINKRFAYYTEKEISLLSRQLSDKLKQLESFSMNELYDQALYNNCKKAQQVTKKGEGIDKYIFEKNFENYLKALIRAEKDINLVAVQFYSGDDTIYGATEKFINVDTSTIPIEEINCLAKDNIGAFYYFQNKNNDNKINDIYLARNFYNIDTYEKIGIIIFRLNKPILFEQFKYLINDPINTLYVFSENYKEIWGENYKGKNTLEKAVNLVKLNQSEDIYSIKEEHNTKYFIINSVPEVNWKLITYISPDLLLKDLNVVSNKIVFLCIIMIPIFLIIVNLFYKDLIKPIYALVNKMKIVEEGHIGQTIESNRKDEIGYLFQSFNNMSLRIKHLIDYVYKEEIALKDAEIKALQTQINPHFLYNTLETISWKAMLSGNNDIVEMIRALAEITEVNIDRQNEKFVTIEHEIKYMDNYILLIKKRFGEKILFEKTINNELLNYKIPKLVIQPLVENAVYHGIEPVGRGKIKIQIDKLNNDMLIKIEDNGIGIKEEEIKKLINALQDDGKVDTIEEIKSNTKIGLINVHRRIQLIYGQKYGLTIKSCYDKGTWIEIILPQYSKIRGKDYVQGNVDRR